MKRTDHHLIQQVLDGSLTREAFDGFQTRLRNEPELAKLYSEYAMLHHSLSEEYEGQRWKGGAFAQPSRLGSRVLIPLATAAVIGLLATVVFRQSLFPSVAPPPFGKATFSMDAVWQIDGGARTPENSINLSPGGTLHLQQGQADIVMGGTTALIEGPAKLTLDSAKSIHLSEGSGRFHTGDSKDGLTVITPSITAVDLGTDFGIKALPGQPAELHVMDGNVKMLLNGNKDTAGLVLAAGEAARVSAAGEIERFPADGKRFKTKLAGFRSIVSGPFHKSDWTLPYGSPMISEAGMDGENFSAFFKMSAPAPRDGDSVLLATIEVGQPASGLFHTDGWAGMSFFSKGAEVLFFGDAFGTDLTWSLDVKQRIPVIVPKDPVVGPRTVTLCYQRKSGDVSLHEGGVPLGAEFCRGKLPAGLEFDEIRLGASAGAALDVRSLTVRVGGGE